MVKVINSRFTGSLIKRFSIVLIVALLAFAVSPAKKIKVWMIGDSTMCPYPPERGPIMGWGVPFGHFFDSSVIVDNRARGGRSTKTFLNEGLWKSVSDSIQSGDYVFIQFGHNDEATEPQYAARYTAIPDYKKNLRKFIAETRAKQGLPVLITPVTRMKFDANGKALETHVAYSAAVIEVGKNQEVPVIDLDKMSRNLLQELGPERAKLLYMQYDAAQEPLFPSGLKDNTHFNEYGARRIAQLVYHEIRRQLPGLAARIVNKQ